MPHAGALLEARVLVVGLLAEMVVRLLLLAVLTVGAAAVVGHQRFIGLQ